MKSLHANLYIFSYFELTLIVLSQNQFKHGKMISLRIGQLFIQII